MFVLKLILSVYLFIEFICISVDSLNVAEYIQMINNDTVNNKSTKTHLRIPSVKKWQISRVTEKRYEIVNVLWRKTKIFGDVESITQTTQKKLLSKKKRDHNVPESMSPEKLTFSLPYLRRSSSTPSYIEFHYLDLIGDKENSSSNKNVSKFNYKERQRPVINSPFFVFHVQYETCKSTNVTPKPIFANSYNFSKFLAYITSPKKLDIEDTTNSIDMETCPLTTLPPTTIEISSSYNTIYYTKQDNWPIRETTMYDKIKFFELYDNDTPTPRNKIRTTSTTTKNNEKELFDDIDFMDVLQSTNKARFVKKHIDRDTSDYINKFFKHFSKGRFTETTAKPTSFNTKQQNMNRPARWSDFPFVAVYIYNPSQVHCDAAALSPHWLLAAASCLSRQYRDIYYEEAQSAYVAYCTDNWRNSERISYVKRSFVHPRFDGSDNMKRHLYNIGVIEIVNSMAETCNGWAPITLISHQFDANAYGSMGVALGWGLDRHNASYPINTKYSLMMYENLVYSDFCPGRTDSELTKRKNKINEMYCLSLPNYSDEYNDEVHGAMLLIGGKLIALYLQDERRPTGEQSAMYSGVWRHIPWLVHTAREPEEFVTVSLDF